jgi:hypothetical protein
MNCKQAKNLFDAYLDGELSRDLGTELAAHRVGCASCRRELALMEVATQVVAGDDGGLGLGGDFTDRLLACIDTPERSWLARHRRTILTAAPLAMAACLTLVVFNPWHTEPDRGVLSVSVEIPDSGNQTTDTDSSEQRKPDDWLLAPNPLMLQLEQNWQAHRESADDILRIGELNVIQILDLLGVERSDESKVDEQNRALEELRRNLSDDSTTSGSKSSSPIEDL